MESKFFKTSKEIANEFLQNIVFIDDKAFTDGKRNSHEFNAHQITQAFAKSKKVCAVYKPETSVDIDNLALLAKKADITVIDWQIRINEEEGMRNSEKDAEEEGSHTRKIIREILSDPLTGKGSLKLILIYTGEIGLYDITDAIFEDLNTIGMEVQKDDCMVFRENIKILVVAKPSVDGEERELKFKHNPKLNEKIVTYEGLPDFILTEFTKMTSGLLSNLVLSALTAIRKNSYKLLSLFSAEMDNAYLSNKSLLPNPDDAEHLLIDLIRDSLGDLFMYAEIDSVMNDKILKEWINNSLNTENKPIVNKRGNQIDDNEFERTCEFLEKLLSPSESDVEKRYRNVFKEVESFMKLNPEQKDAFLKYILFNNISLFINNEQTNPEELNKKFASLTHHKSLFMPSSIIPKLNLGTVVKGIETGKYWVCIQQKCDSVRIYSQERKFLFLPLKSINNDANNKFNFVSPEGIRLQLEAKSYSIRTIKFVGHNESGVVKGEELDGKFIFKQLYSEGYELYNKDVDENFEWVFDLKDLHAQRIAVQYASQLSRVGLDESEWLRRWAGN